MEVYRQTGSQAGRQADTLTGRQGVKSRQADRKIVVKKGAVGEQQTDKQGIKIDSESR